MKRRTFLGMLAAVPFVGSAVVNVLIKPQPQVADDFELMGFDLVKSGGQPIRGLLWVMFGRPKIGKSSLADYLANTYAEQHIVIIDEHACPTGEERLEEALEFVDQGRTVLLIVREQRNLQFLDAYGAGPDTLQRAVSTLEVVQRADVVFRVEAKAAWENETTGEQYRTWRCRMLKDRMGVVPDTWAWDTRSKTGFNLVTFSATPLLG
jgi:hypothetical protein